MDSLSTTDNEAPSSRTILVVEDDEGLRRLVARNLERAGFRTNMAATGSEAIAAFREDPDSLMLLDYRLPDMTAKRIVEALSEPECPVPFVIMTGQGDERIAVEMMKLGALDYIVKDAGFMDVLPQVVVRVLRQVDTERKLREAEAKLRESQRSLATLMSNLPGMAYRCQHDRRRTMTFVSEGCKDLTGYEPASLEGNKTVAYIDLIHREDRRMVLGEIRAALAERRPFQPIYRIHSADGQEKWVWEKGAGVYSQKGKLIGLEGFLTEITERKRAEEEKLRMEQQLQLTGRLAAVGELAAGVAHELNNPLAAVQAFSQFLATRQDLDESTKNDLKTIHKEAQRASKITSNLLSFARRHRPERSLISINDAIDKSLELHAYRMKVNNIEVIKELSPEIPMTMADFHQMQQVFVNIVTNAEQALTESRRKGKLRIKTEVKAKTIAIKFEDDGPGIPEQNLNRVFDPFFTTKEVGKGTGLGLSICYGIVHEHGGRIYARSKPGKGTTFVVELPVVTEDQAVSALGGFACSETA